MHMDDEGWEGQWSFWAGGTIGFLIGLIVGLARGPFWTMVFYGVLIGLFVGMLHYLVGRLMDYRVRRGYRGPPT